MDGYGWGYLHGLEQGRIEGWNASEDDMKRHWQTAYNLVQSVAGWPDHSHAGTRARMDRAQREINARLDAIRSQTLSDKQPGRERWIEPTLLQGTTESTATQRGTDDGQCPNDATG